MTDEILFAKQGRIGLVTLNRPQALNALTRTMCIALHRQLMDWAMEEARVRGAREMFLTVYTDNHRARRFYERYGFTEVGPYHFMVGEQADEDIIMRCVV